MENSRKKLDLLSRASGKAFIEMKFRQREIYLSLLKFINNTLHFKEKYVNES
jgi:hypothetical protein